MIYLGGQACLAGACSAPMGGSGNCQDLRADGATCVNSFECRSGSCDKNMVCSSVCAPLR